MRIVLKGSLSKIPFQVLYFKSKKMAAHIHSLLEKEDFDIIHTYTLRMAEYTKQVETPKVLDLIDSMQLNYRKRVTIEKPLFRKAFKVELKRLCYYENEIVNTQDVSILVSESDKKAIHSEKVVVIPLGVDTDVFQRTGTLPDNKTIIFSGNMGYYPNENAIHWFIENCFEAIRQVVPEAKIIIAGNNPSPTVKAYHNGQSICVTGFVKSMPEILSSVQLAIAPMQSGYGMHLKLLEAMSCGLPVVCSSLALGTINAIRGRDVIVADHVTDFSTRCIELLTDYERAGKIGDAARELILREYGWQSHTDRLEKIYLQVGVR